MKDRQPYPGKEGMVRLTLTNGQVLEGKLEMADEAYEPGDPLNKATLLKDSTADLIGLDSNAVPDDALWTLGRLHSGIGNEYIWEKSGTENVPYVNQMGGVQEIQLFTGDIVFYSKEVVYNKETKKVELVKPGQITMTNSDDASFLSDYYVDINYGTPYSSTFKCMSVSGNESEIYLNGLGILVKEVTGVLGYVNSPDPEAYPAQDSNGNKYSLIGQIGNKANIVTGSYTGTGEETKILSFERLPVFLLIYTEMFGLQGDAGWVFWAKGVTSVNPGNSDKYPFVHTNFSISGNTITINGTGLEGDNSALAFNFKDRVYRYLAFVV